MSMLRPKIFICTLLVVEQALFAMQLDNLCESLVGNIIVQLNNNVGTPSLINQNDIPVIVKYVKSLSFVNKNLYRKVNGLTCSRMFVKALAHRFGMTQLNAIGEINTPGARLVIDELLEPGEYEVYKTVRRIIEIADAQRKEFKKFKFFYLEKGQSSWPGIDTCRLETKQGLVLLHGWFYPRSLATPWGVVRLSGSSGGTDLIFLAFTQEFFKNFKTTYMYHVGQKLCDGVKYYEYDQLLENANSKPVIALKDALISGKEIDAEAAFKKMVRHEFAQNSLKERDGKECYIRCCNYEDTLYRIHEVEGVALPEPIMQERELYREYKVSDIIWRMFTKRYHVEKGQTKEVCEDIKVIPRGTYSSKAKNRNVKSIKEFSDICDYYLEQLDKQALKRDQKILPLENSDHRRLIFQLCLGVKHKIGQNRAWHVYLFDDGLWDGKDNFVKCGLQEYISPENSLTRCTLKQMEEFFHQMLNEVGNSWHKSSLVENPDASLNESEEEWSLFVKPAEFDDEHSLISYIAAELGFKWPDVSCYDNWSTKGCGFERRHLMYLWIKKDILDCFVQAFNLRFAS